MNICVGGVGRAVSALAPSGYVEIEGVRHPARSEGSYIAAGAAVIVLSGSAFGLTVRELEPEKAPPAIPHVGDVVSKAEHQLTSVDVAELEREQRRREGVELRQRMKIGAGVAGRLGVIFGLANASLATHFNWNNVNDAIDPLLLFAGSTLGCVVAGVTLYFATGWLGPQIFPYEERAFAADFLGIGMGLLGGLIGFWLRFGEPLETVAMLSGGLTVAFAGVGCGISWLLSLAANL